MAFLVFRHSTAHRFAAFGASSFFGFGPFPCVRLALISVFGCARFAERRFVRRKRMARRGKKVSSSDDGSSARSEVSNPIELADDASMDPALRPKRLEDFAGQPDCVRILRVSVNAALSRSEPVDHVLLFGPPGLGKTTLAQIVAEEMGFVFQSTSAPAISRPGDLAAILAAMEPNTVLFIDEIHRLNKVAAELLYMAMEDRRLDLVVGEGAQTRSMRIELVPFTLVGATTRAGMLPSPLRDRFGIHLRLEFYSDEDLAGIVARTASLMALPGETEAWMELARRARGTPRLAKRLLRRVRDFAHSDGASEIALAGTRSALLELGVDESGLDALDRRYLDAMSRHYGGGPVGVETLAATLSEDREILETAGEPFRMMRGLVQRTPRGRALTTTGRDFLRAAQDRRQAASGTMDVSPRVASFDVLPGDRGLASSATQLRLGLDSEAL
jgi:Holliday junction DNA helicase RuvB